MMMVSKIAVLFMGTTALLRGVWAQPVGEGAGQGQPTITQATAPYSATPQNEPIKRSALWMTIQTQQRESGGESTMVERRLTPAERSELRDQVRRAAGQADVSNGMAGSRMAGPDILPVRR
ncbi:hypothetical protein [Ottowia sp. VDI28]|uniref:hypothetical protein n=1 Tax=unclassified Ottowia TaxID=2645081 RepID=UPI003C2F2A14